MGCRNACICGGRCSESCYEAERYCGEAEDIYDELYGKSKEEEEYYKAMEEQEENEKSNVLLADIIEAFTSCSYNDDFEMAQAGREIYELFNGGKDPKEVFHNAEVPKSSRQLLKEAKELLEDLIKFQPYIDREAFFISLGNEWKTAIYRAEQFLKGE